MTLELTQRFTNLLLPPRDFTSRNVYSEEFCKTIYTGNKKDQLHKVMKQIWATQIDYSNETHLEQFFSLLNKMESNNEEHQVDEFHLN